MEEENPNCDPQTGECAPADLGAFEPTKETVTDKEIIYVGYLCVLGVGVFQTTFNL